MKKVLLWTNCQGGAISYMLNKYYSDKYEIKSFLNYEYIRENKTLPEDFIDADVFIYQNYNSDKHVKDYDLDNIIKNVLKPYCKTICIPFLFCDSLFSYEMRHSPNNYKTISDEKPFGYFAYGCSLIDDKMIGIDIKNYTDSDKEKLIEDIYEYCMSENAITDEQLKCYYDRSFSYLESKIMSGDLPFLLDYIKENFTKIRLWYNRNHPTGELMKALVGGVFELMGLNFNCDDADFIVLDGLKDWEMPIFPCVKKYHNMTFDETSSSIWIPSILDKKSFVREYIKLMYFDFI